MCSCGWGASGAGSVARLAGSRLCPFSARRVLLSWSRARLVPGVRGRVGRGVEMGGDRADRVRMMR
jgi:hypothetical protein